MTREQKQSLRDALDADLRGEPVEMYNGSSWVVVKDPSFCASFSFRAAPKEPIKRWVIDGDKGVWNDPMLAEIEAKSLGKDLIELTETSRQSFDRKPRRFWGTSPQEGNAVVWWPSKTDAVNYVKNNGGRVAEFEEIVK